MLVIGLQPMTSRARIDGAATHIPLKTGNGAGPKLDVLTRRLNSLSVEERDEALHDLHGVADQKEETPKLIKTKTQEMTHELLSLVADLKSEESAAYRKALALSPKYVETMKLVFLRAEVYSVQYAASRMIRFFKVKRDLFGEKKLVRDITLKDLGEEEQDILRKGFIHILPHRDRAGRAIMLTNGQVNSSCSNHDVMRRVTYYMLMTLVREEENQIKGIVGIYYAIGQKAIIPGRFFRLQEVLRATPARVVGRHIVREGDSALEPMFQMLATTLEKRFLYQLRYHSGSSQECIYSLMTFGIPKEALPIADDGSVVLTDHDRVLKALQCREEKERDATIFVHGTMDVLMGRGRQPAFSPGLLRMHHLLVEHQEAYENASRLKKVDVARAVLKEMKDSGCRFLKPVKGGYVESDESAVIDKISHGFRHLRMKTKKKEESQKTAKKRSLDSSS